MACCKNKNSDILAQHSAEVKLGSTSKLKKVILVGDSGVGKTTLLRRLSGEEISDTHTATIGVDFREFKKDSDSPYASLQIWDTAGQERFRTIVSSYYRNCNLVIGVFNITKPDTLRNLKRWIEDAEKYAINDFKLVIMIIATQSDTISETNPRCNVVDICPELFAQADFYHELSGRTGLHFKTFMKALEEFARTGDIVKTRTKIMDKLGVKITPREVEVLEFLE
jgi:small GTP-binding protein